MNTKLKLALAIIYAFCLGFLLFYIFTYLDLKDLTNYTYIKDQSEILIDYKKDNLIVFILLFFIFTVIWVLLLGFGGPIALIAGFIFGKWLGTFITVISFSIGSTLLYSLAGLYLKETLHNYLESKISKFKAVFNKNEFLYFMIFRFAGGGGIPFAIQNVLPVIFNMKIKNYFYSTLLGLIPTIFIINSLGDGINIYLKNNNTIDYLLHISSPDIYGPLVGFLILLIISYFVREKFFKSK